MDQSLTDEALVAEVFQNKERYRLLVERYQDKLLRYLYRLGAGPAAEDLLQEVFLKAYQNLASFDSRLSFSSWVYRIAHNTVMSHFRATKVRPEGNLHPDNEEMLQRLWCSDESERRLDNRLDAKRLELAMSKLKPLYRDVLTLRYFEQLEYREISDVLKVSQSSVTPSLHRAKKQLRELYEHT